MKSSGKKHFPTPGIRFTYSVICFKEITALTSHQWISLSDFLYFSHVDAGHVRWRIGFDDDDVDDENDDCSNPCYTSFEQMKTGQKGIFSNFKSQFQPLRFL